MEAADQIITSHFSIMDSLTHIAIGACIGEAMLGKQLGKRGMLIGAIAQSVPDIDFLAAFWLSPSENLLAHRGFTHSVLFTTIVAPLLALASWHIHKPHNIKLRKWILFFGLNGLLHILLDGFNSYGVGWLEPFSHHRFSFNTLFVADPLFSLWCGLAVVALLILPRRNKRRVLYWLTGLLASAAYLAYSVSNKIYIERTTRDILERKDIIYDDMLTTPTPFNNWLWYVVARSEGGYYIGFRSVFDVRRDIQLHYFQRNDSLLKVAADHESVQQLIRFSRGYYTVEKWGDTLVFNNLQFGQIMGWDDPHGKFVFHYFLSHQADNKLVVQRGRFEGWNKKTIAALLHRIQGY